MNATQRTIHISKPECLERIDHDGDDEECVDRYPLNQELINFISERGWTLGEKIAEGSFSSVFKCSNEYKSGVLILLTDVNDSDDYANDRIRQIGSKIEFAWKHPEIFPEYYDAFYTDIPYSADPGYLSRSSKFGLRPIQIMQRGDFTVIDYAMTLSSTAFPKFMCEIRKELWNLFEHLVNNDVHHTDSSPCNIVVFLNNGNRYLRFIDVDALMFVYGLEPRSMRTKQNIQNVELFISILENDYRKLYPNRDIPDSRTLEPDAEFLKEIVNPSFNFNSNE